MARRVDVKRLCSLPQRVQRQLQLETVDHPRAIGKCKIVIEQVAAVSGLPENSRQLVAQFIAKRRVVERRVGCQAAAPAKRLAVGPRIVVDVGEMRILGQRLPPGGGVQIESAEDQSLSRSDVECPLTAIPVAGEHQRLGLGDLQKPIRVQMRSGLERIPVQLALREGGARHTEHQDGEVQDSTRAGLHWSACSVADSEVVSRVRQPAVESTAATDSRRRLRAGGRRPSPRRPNASGRDQRSMLTTSAARRFKRRVSLLALSYFG
jgi:hypothetical protein